MSTVNIFQAKSTLSVSAASVWEIAIKHGLAKKNMPISGTEARSWFARAGYTLLPVTAEHAALVGELPSHHAICSTGCWSRRRSRSRCDS